MVKTSGKDEDDEEGEASGKGHNSKDDVGCTTDVGYGEMRIYRSNSMLTMRF